MCSLNQYETWHRSEFWWKVVILTTLFWEMWNFVCGQSSWNLTLRWILLECGNFCSINFQAIKVHEVWGWILLFGEFPVWDIFFDIASITCRQNKLKLDMKGNLDGMKNCQQHSLIGGDWNRWKIILWKCSLDSHHVSTWFGNVIDNSVDCPLIVCLLLSYGKPVWSDHIPNWWLCSLCWVH